MTQMSNKSCTSMQQRINSIILRVLWNRVYLSNCTVMLYKTFFCPHLGRGVNCDRSIPGYRCSLKPSACHHPLPLEDPPHPTPAPARETGFHPQTVGAMRKVSVSGSLKCQKESCFKWLLIYPHPSPSSWTSCPLPG